MRPEPARAVEIERRDEAERQEEQGLGIERARTVLGVWPCDLVAVFPYPSTVNPGGAGSWEKILSSVITW